MTENAASSVYCYCDTPSKYYLRPLDTKYLLLEPKLCGEIFENDGSVMGGMLITTEGWATIYDGAILGHNYNLNSDPVYVGDDRLSLIRASGGNDFSSLLLKFAKQT